MIINLLINFVVLIIGALFSLFPVVTKFPNIFGFDIDAFLVTAIGTVNKVTQVIWPIKYLMLGFIVIMGYYSVMMLVRFFLGHRAPGHK